MTIAHEGSFTSAAARLYLSQPSLSVQIRKLEQDVGARLFERTGRQIVLTAAGAALLEHTEVALAELERGRERVAEVSGLREGEVRVGVLPSIGARMLPDVLAEFRRAHPLVGVRIVEHDISREFEQLVRSGALDLAITRMPLTLSGLCVDVLIREPVLLRIPAEHRLAGRAEATLVELAGEDLVGMRTGYGLRDLADQLLAEAGVRPRVVLETGQLAIVHGMVAAGMGVALLPRLAAGEGPTIPLADPCAFRELGVVSRASAHVSPPVQAFRRLLLRTARE